MPTDQCPACRAKSSSTAFWLLKLGGALALRIVVGKILGDLAVAGLECAFSLGRELASEGAVVVAQSLAEKFPEVRQALESSADATSSAHV